ncbi:outer membrane protein [Rhizobium sp. GCM10022189]|uniref:outer membrane protein n=1 Tax=Rhizobium sp. GCM10022189 TaxID=3252654 RepID=UPI00361D0326
MRTTTLLLSAMMLSAPVMSEAADLAPAMAPQPEPANADKWEFSFAPYIWAAGIDGETAVFGLPTVETHQSFGDILKDIDFGFMGAGEARYGKFSVVTDITYARITTDSATPRGVLADAVDLKSETFAAMLGVGYSVLESPQGRLDVIGGAKLWSVETTISFSGGPLGGVSRRDDATWVDAMAGIRGVYSITPEVYLTGWGLIGAGGADIDWDVMAGIGYKFSDRISAMAGYRALGVNYSDDSLTEDIVEHGPMIGAVFHF